MTQKAVTGIDLDRHRVLLYRVGDAIAAERALGNESIEEAIQKRGYTRLVAFIWAGLRHEDEKLTQERVTRLLDKSSLDYSELWNLVSEALVNSRLLAPPRAKDTEETNGAGPTLAPSSGATGA